jgi:hypothetical protein
MQFNRLAWRPVHAAGDVVRTNGDQVAATSA